MELIVDIETHFQVVDDGKKVRKVGSPYHPDNMLVSIGHRSIDRSIIDYSFYNHNDGCANPSAAKIAFQKRLDECTLFIAHNVKFDLAWLYECGFKYDGPVWDTMIAEYILARGTKEELSLEEIAKARNLTLKKSELIEDYMKKNISYYYIPQEIVEEYGTGDIDTTTELYLAQKADFEKEENKGLIPTLQMMNEFCRVLIDMERAGIPIDTVELGRIEGSLKEQLAAIEKRMKEIVVEVMGDYPYNLDSPEDMSKIVYSREPTDKKKWAEIFNIGTTERNGVVKKNKPPHMSLKEFVGHVKNNTKTVYRRSGKRCDTCQGTGKFRRNKKDGSAFKRDTKCINCFGTGIIYQDLAQVAGLGIIPDGPALCSVGGFSTGKQVLEIYLQSGAAKSEIAREFLGLAIKQGAITSYIDSFVAGIRRGLLSQTTSTVRLCRTSFMQTVTATGRLSSQNPNFQNMPRSGGDSEATFPIRGCVVSRFGEEKAGRIQEIAGKSQTLLQPSGVNINVVLPKQLQSIHNTTGLVLEADYKALEYRCAVDMARDKQGMEDIKNNVDAHAFTRDTLRAAGAPIREGKEGRQQSKPHTFKPLYGGTYGTPAEVTYYKAFLDKHGGIKAWQERLQNEAISNKKIVIPSGREYAFPKVFRLKNGNANLKTQIVNYPVQGFATGDIVPCAAIEIWKLMREIQPKSKLFLTVHDSIAADVFPGELELMCKIFYHCMSGIDTVLKDRYGYEPVVPFDVELKAGPTWRQTYDIEVEKLIHA